MSAFRTLAIVGLGVTILAIALSAPALGQGVVGGEGTGVPLRLAPTAAPIDPAEATRIFKDANAYYAEGRYEEAASLYERILARGFENADVRYNLGNASYKGGHLGRAVLAYERALKLDPEHDDARANLEFVRAILPDRQTVVGGPTSAVFERIYARMTVDRAAVLATVFYFALVAALMLIVLRRFRGLWLSRVAVVAGTALAISLLMIGVKVGEARTHREGIIVETEVGVRTGPGEDFVLEFKLHEGTKVREKEVRGEWTRISVAGTDLEGWAPAAAVEEI